MNKYKRKQIKLKFLWEDESFLQQNKPDVIYKYRINNK